MEDEAIKAEACGMTVKEQEAGRALSQRGRTSS